MLFARNFNPPARTFGSDGRIPAFIQAKTTAKQTPYGFYPKGADT